MAKLTAKIRNFEREAKEENGKFYVWVPRANYGAGAWQRIAKSKIVRR